MYRRGYLALVGAGALAGCSGDGSATPAEPTTDTQRATERTDESGEPAAEQSAESLSGEERAVAEIEDAKTRITDAYDVYVGYASDDGASLRDVAPDTEGFVASRIQSLCRQATEHLDAARQAGRSHQYPRIRRLRSGTTWLSGAAGVQSTIESITGAIGQAERTATGGASIETVVSHLDTARTTVGPAREAIDGLERPRDDAFEEVDAIDYDGVDAKHRSLDAEVSGLETLAGLIADAIGEDGTDGEGQYGGAVGLLQSAQASFEAEDYDDAESAARRSANSFSDVLSRTLTVDPDSLDPVVERFETVLSVYEERADELRDEARVAS